MPSSSEPKVYFFSNGKTISLKNRGVLKAFIISIFKKERKSLAHLNYIFCDDKTLLAINRTFLKHDYLTDTITFNLSQNKNSPITGEVYISIDRIKDNSKTYNVSYSIELHRVIFHGALHLCGYDDKTRKDKIVIRKKEDFYLGKYFKNQT